MELPFPNASALDIPTVHVQKHVVRNDGFLVDKGWPKIDSIQGICGGGGLRKAGDGWKNVHRCCHCMINPAGRNLTGKSCNHRHPHSSIPGFTLAPPQSSGAALIPWPVIAG